MNDYKDYKLRGKVHAPFGPMLIEFTMPQPYVDMFNKYADGITKSKKKIKTTRPFRWTYR